MTLYVKTKIWIENEDQELLFGKGKTELIELIEQEGSIAKAAEKIGMNYKKAWSHIKILQKNIAAELFPTDIASCPIDFVYCPGERLSPHGGIPMEYPRYSWVGGRGYTL